MHICMKCRPKFTTDCLYTCPFYFRIILYSSKGHTQGAQLPSKLAGQDEKITVSEFKTFQPGDLVLDHCPLHNYAPSFCALSVYEWALRRSYWDDALSGLLLNRPGAWHVVPGEGIGWLLLFYQGGKQSWFESDSAATVRTAAVLWMSSVLWESHLYLIYFSKRLSFNFQWCQPTLSFFWLFSLSLSLAHSLWPTLLGSIMSSVIAVRPCALCIPSLLCGRLMRIGEISMPLLDMSHTLRCWTNPCPFLALSLAGLFLFNSARAACCSLVLGAMYSWRPAYVNPAIGL